MRKIYFDLYCHLKTSDFIQYTTEAANNTFALFEGNPEPGHATLKNEGRPISLQTNLCDKYIYRGLQM